MFSGVFRGANRPTQTPRLKGDSPASSSVGASGAAKDLWGELTARILIRPLWASSMAVGSAGEYKLAWTAEHGVESRATAVEGDVAHVRAGPESNNSPAK